jgi:hypothetical protein
MAMGAALGETNPSITPAITSMGIVPSSKRVARPPDNSSESRRDSSPGKRSPRAISNPAPPAMKTAGSSSDPCGATKLHNCKAIPARAVAAPTTPNNNPLTASIQMVPKPPVIPSANMLNATDKLLVMIPDDAKGFTVTMESVHICCCSMASIMCGPNRR